MTDPTTEDEEMKNIDSKPPKSFNPLGTLERVGSSESVQHWIDSITADDWKSSTEDRACSVSDHEGVGLLQLPETTDDDLMLGADAKSLSFEESEQGFPPGTSPLFVNDEEEVHLCNNNSSCHEDTEVKQVDEDGFRIKESSISRNGERPNSIENDVWQTRNINRRQDSLSSFPSVSSLLAAMETDPEDMLISLGFCDDISSQVRRIPARFFANPSQAKGIDVQEVLRQVMNVDSSGMAASTEDVRQGSLSNRFSESSIDLSLVDHGGDMLAKLRRAKFNSTIPSITISEDLTDDDAASEPNAQARMSGYLRLSTVMEENEPGSRRSSLSRSFSGEKRKPLCKQDRVDIEERNGGLVCKDSDDVNTESTHAHSLMIVNSRNDLQKGEEVLPGNTGNLLEMDSNLCISDNNNNSDPPYSQSISTFISCDVTEGLSQSVQVQNSINELSKIAMGLGSREEEGDLGSDMNACKDEKIVYSSESGIKMDSLEDGESERLRSESECSYPDSIEEDFSLKSDRGFLTDVKIEAGDVTGQFSSDSLQDSLSERTSLCEGNAGSVEDPIKENKCFKDDHSSCSSGLARLVYRSLGRIEVLEDKKDTVQRTDAVFESQSIGNPKSKTELIITSYMPSLSNETESDGTPHSGLSQSCFVESTPKKRSPIRDYFRKLASGRKRRFFSLESLNTIKGKERFQSTGNPLFPNRSALADERKAMAETSGSLPFRKHSDSGLEKFRELASGNVRIEKEFNNSKEFSVNGNEHSRILGKKNFEYGKLNDVCVGFAINSKIIDVPMKQTNGRISKMNGHSPCYGMNGEGELVHKQAKKVLLKGCSIESSGFEEENGAGRSSPERGYRTDQRVDNDQACEHCLQRNMKQTILEAPLPAPTHNGKYCMQSKQISSLDQNSDCGLTKDRFDYLIVQVTSLREEINDQEERLKRYIDESMEKVKASILTEISLLNASNRTGSSSISLNIEH